MTVRSTDSLTLSHNWKMFIRNIDKGILLLFQTISNCKTIFPPYIFFFLSSLQKPQKKFINFARILMKDSTYKSPGSEYDTHQSSYSSTKIETIQTSYSTLQMRKIGFHRRNYCFQFLMMFFFDKCVGKAPLPSYS